MDSVQQDARADELTGGSPAATRVGSQTSLADRLGGVPGEQPSPTVGGSTPTTPAASTTPPAPSTPPAPVDAGAAATTAAVTDHPKVAAVPPAPAPPTLDPDVLLRPRPAAPLHGWRRLVGTVSLGTIRLGPSAAELHRAALVRTTQTPIPGTHRVAVISLKGGVGKTTTTIMLGSTLASLRGDRVIAVDANPDAGTLGDRLARQTTATLRDLLTDRESIASWADLARYTSQARSRLEVIANDVDPAVSTAITAQDYLQAVDLLGRYYSVILSDSGTGLLHDAMTGILTSADTLVVVSSASVDGARSAATTLDWLSAQGYGDLVAGAVTVISAVRPAGRAVDVAAIARYFASRCRAVVQIPFDAHLEIGAETDLDALAPATREAYLELAGQVARDFGSARASAGAGGWGPGRRSAPSATFLPDPAR